MYTNEKTQVITRIHFDAIHRTETVDRLLKAFQTTIVDNVGLMYWEYENLDNYFWFPNGVEVRGIYAYICAYTCDRELYLKSLKDNFTGLEISIKLPNGAGYKPMSA